MSTMLYKYTLRTVKGSKNASSFGCKWVIAPRVKMTAYEQQNL